MTSAGAETPRPPAVRPGDRVRLLSPASFPTDDWLADSVAILESWGLVVEVGAHAPDRWGYMAGRDEERLDDLNEAFRDAGVRAIITTRGGARAYRIADDLDVAAVLADPKPVVGFSDITSLHLALWSRCRVASIHGCLAGEQATAAVRQLLMTTTGSRSAMEASVPTAAPTRRRRPSVVPLPSSTRRRGR
jgi:muramoyltetrapeptide carboxypeptidase